jgi:hypothetical protein
MIAKEIRETKIGAGHLSAMGRLGLKELRGALYPESNAAQPSEYGLYGTQTPGEVAEARRGDERDLEEEKPKDSIVDDRLREAESRREDRGDEKQLDRD